MILQVYTDGHQHQDRHRDPEGPFAALPTRSFLLFQLLSFSVVPRGVQIIHDAGLQQTWHVKRLCKASTCSRALRHQCNSKSAGQATTLSRVIWSIGSAQTRYFASTQYAAGIYVSGIVVTSSNWEDQLALTETTDFCSVRHCRGLLPGALWATTSPCVSNCRYLSARAVVWCCKSHTAWPSGVEVQCCSACKHSHTQDRHARAGPWSF